MKTTNKIIDIEVRWTLIGNAEDLQYLPRTGKHNIFSQPISYVCGWKKRELAFVQAYCMYAFCKVLSIIPFACPTLTLLYGDDYPGVFIELDKGTSLYVDIAALDMDTHKEIEITTNNL